MRVADRLVEHVELLLGFVDGVGCGFGIIAQGFQHLGPNFRTHFAPPE
jgi:hypothetical protein